MNQEPVIRIGVLLCDSMIEMELFGAYRTPQIDQLITNQLIKIEINNNTLKLWVNRQLVAENLDKIEFTATQLDKNYGELKDVIIGINFHWERKENQSFQGNFEFLPVDNQIQVINVIPIENYLMSVISSEMNPNGHIEFLKAHAIISRSWLLANIEKSKAPKSAEEMIISKDEIKRWYDREDHHLFDVCADDHCQRYQGIGKIENRAAILAVEETRGKVLVFKDAVCDARFYKCCGGVTENYEYVWDHQEIPYLRTIVDYREQPAGFALNLSDEKAAEAWILGNPPAFCNTQDQRILGKVLKDFDQETKDFYRWKIIYTQSELIELLNKKMGLDLGRIRNLKSLARGLSARICRLLIEGEKASIIIGKELEIRKALSSSHLYSSAFVVMSLNPDEDGFPEKFELIGAGWGHGVGLCQIGAAVMAEESYSCEQILAHYFLDSQLKIIY